MREPLIEVSAVTMQYGALRPLRLRQLTLAAGEHVALTGLDQPAAEVLINLLTGASVPDTGHVRVFGRTTASIADSTEWLTLLDRFGIVSERAALLDSMTIVQNLAIPFSLQIEPPDPEVVTQASSLAAEVGLPRDAWDRPVAEMDPASRMRVRLGRALAFRPDVLLLEHPSAGLPRADVPGFARDLRRVAEGRGLAALTITADPEFAASSAAALFALEPASGKLIRKR
jgi:ABC-type transporter Mla maintaining outer membrane lipid asymmetry ATPase subunit MlaF